MANMTTYEVVMTNGNETFHVGFTARKSRVGLRNMILGTPAGKAIVTFLTDEDEITFGVHSITFLDWAIKFSGYTAKDGGRPVHAALEAR
jgi:hypothetical protein